MQATLNFENGLKVKPERMDFPLSTSEELPPLTSSHSSGASGVHPLTAGLNKDMKGKKMPATPQMQAQTRKKRVKPTVTAACQECRSKHAKCDGLNPCSSCVKKEIQCVYDAARKKRGPVPGRKVKQLEHVITILAKEFAKPNENENQLCLSAMYVTYVDSYNAILYPIIGIPPLFRDYDPFQNSSNEEKAYMYSLLANGAMSFGNLGHAEALLRSARACLVDIFDHSDMKIAASYSLMGLCLVSRGLIDQGRNCNALALSICKNLKNLDIKDPLLETIYRGCMVGVVELGESKHEQWVTLDQVLAELGQYKHIESFKVQIFSTLIAKILLMCATSDIDSVPETFGLLEEAEQCVPEQSPLKVQVKTIIVATRGLLYFLSGMEEQSLECVHQVDLTLSQIPPIYWFPGLLLAALLVIQIRLAYDLPILEDIHRLRKTGDNYPIATLIAQQILDPNCTKYISLIPVIPSLGFVKKASSQPPESEYIPLDSSEFGIEDLPGSLLNQFGNVENFMLDPTPTMHLPSVPVTAYPTKPPSTSPAPNPINSQTPTQVTVWYQSETLKQTYRITPTTTIGDLIEQTPVTNHNQYVLLDKNMSVLPRNAYIVQLFKEPCPVLQLQKLQTWD